MAVIILSLLLYFEQGHQSSVLLTRRSNYLACFACIAFDNRSRISSVGRALDCRAGGDGLDSRDRTKTQGLKITEK